MSLRPALHRIRSARPRRRAGRPRSEVALPFAAIVLAMLPAVLDQTILATALPTVARELGSLSDVSWIVTAYVVAAAASTPLWGKLGDRHGRKRLLEISLAVFVTASALCGAAQDITQLIGLRLVQGAAAGGLMTLAMATVGDLVAPRERGRYQGYIAATFAVATIVGPLVGGALVDHASWRWVRSAPRRSPRCTCACRRPTPSPGRGRSTSPAQRCWRPRRARSC
jgi:MFS family permease